VRSSRRPAARGAGLHARLFRCAKRVRDGRARSKTRGVGTLPAALPLLAAQASCARPSRLKAGCGQNCPPSKSPAPVFITIRGPQAHPDRRPRPPHTQFRSLTQGANRSLGWYGTFLRTSEPPVPPPPPVLGSVPTPTGPLLGGGGEYGGPEVK